MWKKDNRGIPIPKLIEQLKELLPQEPPPRPPPEPEEEFGILNLISAKRYEKGNVEKFIARHRAGLIIFEEDIRESVRREVRSMKENFEIIFTYDEKFGSILKAYIFGLQMAKGILILETPNF